MKISESELTKIFIKYRFLPHHDGSHMTKGCFIIAVTEILSKFDIQVTKEPSDLEAAIAGNKEAARKVLVEMGIIDKDGNLTENYAPLEEPEPKPVGHEFWVIMLKRTDGKIYTDLPKTDGQMYLEIEDAVVALNKHPQKECYHIVKMIANLEGL